MAIKKFIKKISLFCLPFVFLAGLILLVDPYEYFDYRNNVIPQEDKFQTAPKLNDVLWTLIHYKRESHPNILLGDSRMKLFSTQDIKKLTGLEYSNLAYDGGALDEICETFWEAAKITVLKNVYIGMNLNVYNHYYSMNRVQGTKLILSNPLLYIVNLNTINATFLLIKSNLVSTYTAKKESFSIALPKMTKDAFWQRSLDYEATRSYANYLRPSLKYLELQRISQYCKQKGINLTFIIPPTHEDLRKKVRAFGLADAEYKFRRDLAALGPVYDFDWSNDFTVEKVNFKDPYHPETRNVKMITEEIWGNKLKYGRMIQWNENH